MNIRNLVYSSGLAACLGVYAPQALGQQQQQRRHHHHHPQHRHHSGGSQAAPAAEPAADTEDPNAAGASDETASPSQSQSADAPPPSNADSPPASSRHRVHASDDNAPPPTVVVAPASEGAPAAPPLAAIDISVGLRLFMRDLSYNQAIINPLRTYNEPLWYSGAAALQFYPGALVTRNPAAWFGIIAGGDAAPSISANVQGDTNHTVYNSESYSWYAGLRMRVPIGGSEIGLSGSYGWQTYSFDHMAGTAPLIPTADYQFIRGDLDARVVLANRVAILVGAGYLGVLNVGDLTTYYPRASVAGVEAQLGLSLILVAGLEIRAMADARRYFFAMNPVPGDMYVAGGALDQYFSATLSVAYRR